MGGSIGARFPSFSTGHSVYTYDPFFGKLPSELPDSSHCFRIQKCSAAIVERFSTRLVAANQKDPLRILLPETVIPCATSKDSTRRSSCSTRGMVQTHSVYGSRFGDPLPSTRGMSSHSVGGSLSSRGICLALGWSQPIVSLPRSE